MGILYNKFLAWAAETNLTITSANRVEKYKDFEKTVYQIDEDLSTGINSLVSTFVAPTVEAASAKELLHSATCSASTTKDKSKVSNPVWGPDNRCPADYVLYKEKCLKCPNDYEMHYFRSNMFCIKYNRTGKTDKEARIACGNDHDGWRFTPSFKLLSYIGSNFSQPIPKDKWVWLGKYNPFPNSSLDAASVKQEKASNGSWQWTVENSNDKDCMAWQNKNSGEGSLSDEVEFVSCENQFTYFCRSHPIPVVPLKTSTSISRVKIPRDIQNMISPCIEINKKTNDSVLPLVDLYMNPKNKGMINRNIENTIKVAKDYYTKERLGKVFKHLFPLFWHTSLPCFNQPGISSASQIRTCEMAGLEVNCSSLFTKVDTDSGLCCALNIKTILKQGLEFSELVSEMQEEDQDASTNVAEKVKIKTGIGKKNGIKLLLDLNSNFESFGSVSEFFRAFQVFVGQPTEYPVLKQQSVMVKPGHETSLDLTATVLTANPDIRTIRPADRNCYFFDEGENAGLELYQFYSYNSCVFECKILYVLIIKI